ncbi:hypothetical protein TNCV_1447071 [Trichonephila clavipes]|nr:hypothetical protein TNCV_1447071 [Trichonephila clavipes]
MKDVEEISFSSPIVVLGVFLYLCNVSSGGPADSRIAVWCRPIFPSHSNYSTRHAQERAECFGSLPVVRRSTWREPTRMCTTLLKADVGMDDNDAMEKDENTMTPSV